MHPMADKFPQTQAPDWQPQWSFACPKTSPRASPHFPRTGFPDLKLDALDRSTLWAIIIKSRLKQCHPQSNLLLYTQPQNGFVRWENQMANALAIASFWILGTRHSPGPNSRGFRSSCRAASYCNGIITYWRFYDKLRRLLTEFWDSPPFNKNLAFLILPSLLGTFFLLLGKVLGSGRLLGHWRCPNLFPDGSRIVLGASTCLSSESLSMSLGSSFFKLRRIGRFGLSGK